MRTMWLTFLLLLSSLFEGHVCFWHNECDILPVDGCTCISYPHHPRVICSDLDLAEIPDIDSGQAEVIILDFSGNNLNPIGDVSFGSVPLEELIISNNKQRLVLTDNSLSPRQKEMLLHLIMKNDGFVNIPSLLRDMENLITLDLSFNDIAVIGEGDFQGLGSLHRLVLEGNPIQAIFPFVFSDMRALQEISITVDTSEENIREIIDANNIQDLNERIQVFELNGDQVNNLRFLKPFSRLESLKLVNCHLTDNKLFSTAIMRKSAEYFKYLDLSSNSLTGFPHEFLYNCENIAHVNLAHNDLQGNKIHVQTWEDGTLYPHLAYLDLSSNKIDDIQSATFEANPNLRYLDLSHNELQAIWGGTFASLQHLEFLDLSDNAIVTLADSAFLNPMPPDLTVAITDNPFECINCSNEWLVNAVAEQASAGIGPFDWYDVHNTRCVVRLPEGTFDYPTMLHLYNELDGEFYWVF